MSKSHKILILSSTILMLTGLGASSINNVTNPVHASRISNLQSRRNRDYKNINSSKRDIKRINNEINRIEQKKNRRHSNKAKLGYQSGQWFVKNAPSLYRHFHIGKRAMDHVKNLNTDLKSNFTYGYETSMPTEFDKYPGLERSLAKKPEEYYRYGWIIGFANHGKRPSAKHGGTATNYRRAKNIYYQGRKFDNSPYADEDSFSVYKDGRWMSDENALN